MKISTLLRLTSVFFSLTVLSAGAQPWNINNNTYTAYNLGIGTAATSPNIRLDVVKSANTVYTAVFRSAVAGNDAYLYHAIGQHYHQIGSSKNGGGFLRKLGFAIGTTDGEDDIKMTIDVNGSVGIGTKSPDAKLAVNGDIHAKEVRIDVNIPAPDYVFEADYTLMPLSVLAKYLNENKHLPEVPAGKELEEKGVNVSEMSMLLLKKVEELTLYMLELRKENEMTKSENDQLKQRVEALENQKQ
jgi:hypothetical protein